MTVHIIYNGKPIHVYTTDVAPRPSRYIMHQGSLYETTSYNTSFVNNELRDVVITTR